MGPFTTVPVTGTPGEEPNGEDVEANYEELSEEEKEEATSTAHL